MSKKIKLLAIISLMVICVAMLGACELEYGQPDSLGIGSMSFGDKLWIGIQVAFLGVATVFVVLAVLIGFVVLLKYIFVWKDQITAKIKAAKKAKVVEDKPLEAATIVVASDDEEEVIAAITAALQAYYDAQQEVVYKSNVTFKVRSIKEIK